MMGGAAKRRLFQFRLKSLLIVMLLLSLTLSNAMLLRELKRRRATVSPPTNDPSMTVNMSLPTTTDADLQWLFGCTDVKYLDLGGTQVTDAGVNRLWLNSLSELKLNDTKITDNGLKHFRGQPNLRKLDLSRTQVTDAGLKNLTLCGLERLDLGDTAIAGAGLEGVQLPDLSELRLYGTKVADDDLKYISQFSDLTDLDLSRTEISDDGLLRLTGLENLEYVNLEYTQVTNAGLRCLEDLNRLRRLSLANTNVTYEGVQRLQELLPKCDIRY